MLYSLNKLSLTNCLNSLAKLFHLLYKCSDVTTWCLASRFRWGSKICVTPLGTRALGLSQLPTSFPVNVCDLIQPFSLVLWECGSLELIFQSDRLALPQCSSAPSALKHTHTRVSLLLMNSLLATRSQIFLSIVLFIASSNIYIQPLHIMDLYCVITAVKYAQLDMPVLIV